MRFAAINRLFVYRAGFSERVSPQYVEKTVENVENRYFQPYILSRKSESVLKSRLKMLITYCIRNGLSGDSVENRRFLSEKSDFVAFYNIRMKFPSDF